MVPLDEERSNRNEERTPLSSGRNCHEYTNTKIVSSSKASPAVMGRGSDDDGHGEEIIKHEEVAARSSSYLWLSRLLQRATHKDGIRSTVRVARFGARSGSIRALAKKSQQHN